MRVKILKFIFNKVLSFDYFLGSDKSTIGCIWTVVILTSVSESVVQILIIKGVRFVNLILSAHCRNSDSDKT